MQKCFFVTGIGTNVGKTIVSLCLLQAFSKIGQNPIYSKIIQTGINSYDDAVSDADFIYRYSNFLPVNTQKDATLFTMPKPQAPLFANIDGSVLGKEIVLNAVQKRLKLSGVHILEGAGGLLVPINDDYFFIDLIAQIDCEVILVSNSEVGLINHTLLSLEALAARNIKVRSLICSINFENDMLTENLNFIKQKYDVGEIIIFEHIDDFYNIPKKLIDNIITHLG